MGQWPDVVLGGGMLPVLVAPFFGRGIYYGDGRRACCALLPVHIWPTGRARDLQLARKLFMREHKSVFKVLGAMQNAYYPRSDEAARAFRIALP